MCIALLVDPDLLSNALPGLLRTYPTPAAHRPRLDSREHPNRWPSPGCLLARWVEVSSPVVSRLRKR